MATQQNSVPAPLIPGDVNASSGLFGQDLVVKGNTILGTDASNSVTINGSLDLSGDIELDDVVCNSILAPAPGGTAGAITGFTSVVATTATAGDVSGFVNGTFSGTVSASTATFTGPVSGTEGSFPVSLTGGHVVATTGTLGTFGAGPVAQATTAVASAAFVASTAAANVHEDATFGGYTIGQVVQALQDYGLLE